MNIIILKDFKFKEYIEKNYFNILVFVIILILFNIILYYNIEIYNKKNSEKKLIENMEMLNLILEEKKTQVSGYAIAIARFRGLFDLKSDNLLKRRMFDLDSELRIRGIEVYNSESELVFKTGSSFNVVEDENLTDSIFQVLDEGYTMSFFSENDLFELQINAVSPIYDEYSINTSGFIIVSDVILKEDFQKIANNIDGIVQFFKNEDFNINKDQLFSEAKFFRRKGYYIKREEVKNMFYLVGYLPVHDFYNNIIGYITIFKPGDNNSKLLYKLILISFIYTIIIIYLLSKIKLKMLIE